MTSPPPRQALGEVVQDRGGAGVGLRCGAGQLGQQHVEVALHRTGRHVRKGAVAEQGQADGVPLAQHQVGEGGREAAAVAELADRPCPPESHRAAGVDQEIGFEVGLLFVALDVEAVGLGQGLPVEVADRVARHVGPVLGELDREPVVGGPVQAGDEPLDHETGDQVETAQSRHCFGIEKGGRIRGGRRGHRESGPAWMGAAETMRGVLEGKIQDRFHSISQVGGNPRLRDRPGRSGV